MIHLDNTDLKQSIYTCEAKMLSLLDNVCVCLYVCVRNEIVLKDQGKLISGVFGKLEHHLTERRMLCSHRITSDV